MNTIGLECLECRSLDAIALALAQRVLDVIVDFPERGLVDERPLIDFLLERVTYAKLAHDVGQALGEFAIHVRLNEKTVHAYTRLARVAKLRCHRTLHRSVEIGVIEHDERSVTPEFQ